MNCKEPYNFSKNDSNPSDRIENMENILDQNQLDQPRFGLKYDSNKNEEDQSLIEIFENKKPDNIFFKNTLEFDTNDLEGPIKPKIYDKNQTNEEYEFLKDGLTKYLDNIKDYEEYTKIDRSESLLSQDKDKHLSSSNKKVEDFSLTNLELQMDKLRSNLS